jgi:hypothetical protein
MALIKTEEGATQPSCLLYLVYPGSLPPCAFEIRIRQVCWSIAPSSSVIIPHIEEGRNGLVPAKFVMTPNEEGTTFPKVIEEGVARSPCLPYLECSFQLTPRTASDWKDS